MKKKFLLLTALYLSLISCFDSQLHGKYVLTSELRVFIYSLNFTNDASVIIEENFTKIPRSNKYQINDNQLLITDGYYLNYSFTINKNGSLTWNQYPIAIFQKP